MTDETAKPIDDPLAEALAQQPEPAGHPILSAADIAKAKENALKKVMDARRKSAMRAIEEEETRRLEIEEGLHTGDGVKDEIVDVTLDLAEHSDRIWLNGVAYFHSHTYRVPRHVADTLREVQARGWAHQDEIDGKPGLEAYRRPIAPIVSPRGVVTAQPQNLV